MIAFMLEFAISLTLLWSVFQSVIISLSPAYSTVPEIIFGQNLLVMRLLYYKNHFHVI